MPSPGFGDNFFLMARDNARRFSEIAPSRRRLTGARLRHVRGPLRLQGREAPVRCCRAGEGGRLRRWTPLEVRLRAASPRTPRSSRPSGNRSTWRPIAFMICAKRFRPLGDDPRIDPGVATAAERPLSRRHHARSLDILLREGAARRPETVHVALLRVQRPWTRGAAAAIIAERPMLFCSSTGLGPRLD